jgi:large subunit ribosomal protein L4
MNRKERRKALFCALSAKLANNQLVIVDKIDLSDAKTKNMVAVCNKLPYEKNMLLAIPSKDKSIERTAANLPYVKTILADYLNIKDILKYKTLVIVKDSLDTVNALAK